jgi:HEAT repeat protein
MRTYRNFAVLVALILVLVTAASGQAQQPPTDAEFTEHIQRLDPKHEKAARLEALTWLRIHSDAKHAAQALTALEKCVRDDPESEVRQRAVTDLCHLAKRLNQPCPLAAIEALLDHEDLVRYHAIACMPFFKTYAPGSVDVLLRGVQAENADVRSSCLYILARAGAKDTKAHEAMEKAKQDKVLDVRHSAHVALFIARDKLDEHLPYLIRLREDPTFMLSPVPEKSELGKKEREYRNLVLIGIAVNVLDWSDTRADELADVLMKLLKHESPLQRRGAAKLIGMTAVQLERPAVNSFNSFGGPGVMHRPWSQSILPYVNPVDKPRDDKPKTPPLKSFFAHRLQRLGVEATLRQLHQHDPDASVRDAARWALDRLASVNQKKE